MRKNIIGLLVFICLITAFAATANAAATDQVLSRWEKKTRLLDREAQVSNLAIKATYYSTEYIEALVQSEANKNLWTQQEADEYKYRLLNTLHLEEMIPIRIEFMNNGPSMHLGPFDVMAKLMIGSKEYKMADYDKRFNFRFQGEKEGLVFFNRYDEKTGKDLLKGVKQVKLIFSPTISPITDGRRTEFIWDIANDDPNKLFQGRAAAKYETDRLLKRLEKLRADKAEEAKKMAAIDSEISTIQARLDELAAIQ